jgi:hypothetical protein
MSTFQARAMVDDHAAEEVCFAPKFHVVDGKIEKIWNFDAA